MYYHAHVYWNTPEEKEVALKIRTALEDMGCKVGKVHDALVGPHPLPMFQAIYHSDVQVPVETVIKDMRGTLTVLLHEAINDDVRDHTEGARWLGETLNLDLVWLDEYVRSK